MKINLIYLFLIITVPITNAYSADDSEIKKFCQKTKSYDNCMIEFQGVQDLQSGKGLDKPIKIKVIPWKL